MPALAVASATDVGRERDHNEDVVATAALPSGAWALVVCDGMGGHARGEVASAVALAAILDVLRRPGVESWRERVIEALRVGNDAVVARGRATGHPGMGTTAAIAVVDPADGRCWAGWVGDSRVEVYRAGEVVRRSEDHTRVRKMVEYGILTAEQAARHPDRGVLAQALGGGDEAQRYFAPEAWDEAEVLRASDVVVVCSDGLHGPVASAEIGEILRGRTPEEACLRLIAAANAAGGPDNISVAVAVAGPAAQGTLPG